MKVCIRKHDKSCAFDASSLFLSDVDSLPHGWQICFVLIQSELTIITFKDIRGNDERLACKNYDLITFCCRNLILWVLMQLDLKSHYTALKLVITMFIERQIHQFVFDHELKIDGKCLKNRSKRDAGCKRRWLRGRTVDVWVLLFLWLFYDTFYASD